MDDESHNASTDTHRSDDYGMRWQTPELLHNIFVHLVEWQPLFDRNGSEDERSNLGQWRLSPASTADLYAASIVNSVWRHSSLRMMYTNVKLSFFEDAERYRKMDQLYNLRGSLSSVVLRATEQAKLVFASEGKYANARQITLAMVGNDKAAAPMLTGMPSLCVAELLASWPYNAYQRTASLQALAANAPLLRRLRLSQAIVNPETIDTTILPVFALTSLHLHACALSSTDFEWLLNSQRGTLRKLGLSWLYGLERDAFISTVVAVAPQIEILCLSLEAEQHQRPAFRRDLEGSDAMPRTRLPSLRGCSSLILRACHSLRKLYYHDPAGNAEDILQLRTLETLHIIRDRYADPHSLHFLFEGGQKRLPFLKTLAVYRNPLFAFDRLYRNLYRNFQVAFECRHYEDPETFMAEHDPMPAPKVL